MGHFLSGFTGTKICSVDHLQTFQWDMTKNFVLYTKLKKIQIEMDLKKPILGKLHHFQVGLRQSRVFKWI